MLQRFLVIIFLAISIGSYALDDDQSEQKRHEEMCLKAKKYYHDICQNKSFHFTNPGKSADCWSVYHTLANLCKQAPAQSTDQSKSTEKHKWDDNDRWNCDNAKSIYRECLTSYHSESLRCRKLQNAAREACKNDPDHCPFPPADRK